MTTEEQAAALLANAPLRPHERELCQEVIDGDAFYDETPDPDDDDEAMVTTPEGQTFICPEDGHLFRRLLIEHAARL